MFSGTFCTGVRRGVISFKSPWSSQAGKRAQKETPGDLPRGFNGNLTLKVKALHDTAVYARPSKTDILGAVQVALEEFESNRNRKHKILMILSDFIQDNSQFDFKNDRRLSGVAGARQLAGKLAGDGHTTSSQFAVSPNSRMAERYVQNSV